MNSRYGTLSARVVNSKWTWENGTRVVFLRWKGTDAVVSSVISPEQIINLPTYCVSWDTDMAVNLA